MPISRRPLRIRLTSGSNSSVLTHRTSLVLSSRRRCRIGKLLGSAFQPSHFEIMDEVGGSSNAPTQTPYIRKRNPAAELLHQRIEELIPYGLDRIWMRLQGTDEYHMASVLGYRVEDFLTLVRVAGLEDGRGIIAASFGTVLEFEVEIDPCNIKGRPRENWILFTAAIDMSAGRKRRRDSAGGAGDAAAVEKQTAAHPYSEAADVLLYEYYI
ncbi:hypothetical protein B484DRAFT_104850 [Ochromonadaceae sp. CCMP2298]|nr:hypothetical protein B484DRAFT_104850 [Ochromonadaceae sp. CCMP2298]